MSESSAKPDRSPDAPDSLSSNRTSGREKWLARNPWVIYVFPLAVFMLVGVIEPKPPAEAPPADAPSSWWILSYDSYPAVYTVKIALTLAAVALVWPGYRQFKFRMSPLALPVGALGAVLWIGLCRLHLEPALLRPIGPGDMVELGQRSGFNPFEQLAGNPAWAYGFFAIRLFGLVILVPLIEEFFLRGFVMRFVVRADWWNVPFGQVNRSALIAGTLIPVLMHPGEILAALVWFSLITWLMLRTKNIWDCVIAHAATNLLMGVWVIASGDWQLM